LRTANIIFQPDFIFSLYVKSHLSDLQYLKSLSDRILKMVNITTENKQNINKKS